MHLGKIYLSGKMTGLPDWGHSLFNKKAKELRSQGYTVFNPAENDGGSTDKPRSFYLRSDIKELLNCDSVLVLDNWKSSAGARLEVEIAKELEMPIIDERFVPIHEETICQEADYLVSEDRGNNYGHPIDDFSRTGKIWSAILEKWAKETKGDLPIPAELVGLCMIGVKLSRETHLHKRDNLVDAAGYAKTVDMIVKRRKELHNKNTTNTST